MRLELGNCSWRGGDVRARRAFLEVGITKQRTRLGNVDGRLEVLCGGRTGRTPDMVAGLCCSGIVHGLFPPLAAPPLLPFTLQTWAEYMSVKSGHTDLLTVPFRLVLAPP